MSSPGFDIEVREPAQFAAPAPLWHNFFTVSPYEDLDTAQYIDDVQGWNSADELFAQLICRLRPALIVEVGSWKGASAIHMANIVRHLNLPTQILCVDTWLGSPEMFTARMSKFGAQHMDMNVKHGWPNIYYKFLANVSRRGLSNIICPLPLHSTGAAQLVHEAGLKADLIYIDASHDFLSVFRDLEDWWGNLSEGGVIVGDDYNSPSWPGVTAAAQTFSSSRAVPIWGRPEKFVIAKNVDANDLGLI